MLCIVDNHVKNRKDGNFVGRKLFKVDNLKEKYFFLRETSHVSVPHAVFEVLINTSSG